MSKEIELAMTVLRNAMRNDLDYAHSWHCNIAVAAQDAICNGTSEDVRAQANFHQLTNEGASIFMRRCFDVITDQDPSKQMVVADETALAAILENVKESSVVEPPFISAHKQAIVAEFGPDAVLRQSIVTVPQEATWKEAYIQFYKDFNTNFPGVSIQRENHTEHAADVMAMNDDIERAIEEEFVQVDMDLSVVFI